MKKPDLSVDIGKLRLKNPVTVASGTFGYAEEFKDFMDLKRLGAIVTKTVTVKPRKGNPPPRTCETPSGLLNSIGLENPGIDAFITDKVPFLEKLGIPVIMSIASEGDPVDFVELAEKAGNVDAVSAVEINISCPNVSGKGRCKLVSQDPERAAEIVRLVRKATTKPVITKLSPNVTDITEIALAAQEAGSDALSLINTLTGMAVDIDSRRPKLANITGGLSGPAVRPVAVRMTWEVCGKVKIPVIAMGGITDWRDAVELIICGATMVCAGTVNFTEPSAATGILDGIQDYMARKGIPDLKALRGTVRI
ncbi:MAG: dihydroorotate dehydrogenase [Deltaproteobacteria bacterium]